jgi:hypothetical protein
MPTTGCIHPWEPESAARPSARQPSRFESPPEDLRVFPNNVALCYIDEKNVGKGGSDGSRSAQCDDKKSEEKRRQKCPRLRTSSTPLTPPQITTSTTPLEYAIFFLDRLPLTVLHNIFNVPSFLFTVSFAFRQFSLYLDCFSPSPELAPPGFLSSPTLSQ